MTYSRTFIVFLLLCVATVSVYAQSKDSIDEQIAKTEGFNRNLADYLTELKRKIPRKDIRGQDSPQRIEADQTSLENYAWFLGTLAVIPAVIAVLHLLGCVLFCFFRYICNCCGGRSYKGAGYQRSQVRRTRCSLLLFSVLGFAFASSGMTGNTFFGNSIDKTFSFIDSIAGMIIGKLDGLKNEVMDIAGIFNAADQIDTAPYDAAMDVLRGGRANIASINDDYVQEYDGYRDLGTWIYFVAFGGAMAGYFVFSCLMWAFFTYVLTIVFWIFSIISWLVLAVFLPISVGLSDVCFEIDYAMQPQNNDTESFLDQLIQCIDPNDLSAFTDHIMQLRIAGIFALNYDSFMISQKSSNFPYMNMTMNNVNITETNVEEARAVFNLSRWETESSEPANTTVYIEHGRQMFETMDRLPLLVTEIEVLATCQFVKDALTGFRNILCIDILVAVDLMTFGIAGASVLSLVIIPNGVSARKRFKKKNSAAALSLKEKQRNLDNELNEFDSRPPPGVVPAPALHHSSQSSQSSYSSSGSEGGEYETRPAPVHHHHHAARHGDTRAMSPPPYEAVAAAPPVAAAPVAVAPVAPAPVAPAPVAPAIVVAPAPVSPTPAAAPLVMPAAANPYAPSPYAQVWGQHPASTYGVYDPVFIMAPPMVAPPLYTTQAQPAPSAPMLTVDPNEFRDAEKQCNQDVNRLNDDDV